MKQEQFDKLISFVAIIFVISIILSYSIAFLNPRTKFKYTTVDTQIGAPGDTIIFYINLSIEGGFREFNYKIEDVEISNQILHYEISETSFKIRSGESKSIKILVKISEDTSNMTFNRIIIRIAYYDIGGHSRSSYTFRIIPINRYNNTSELTKENIRESSIVGSGNLPYGLDYVLLYSMQFSFLLLIFLVIINFIRKRRNKKIS